MAINPETRFAGKITASSDAYPYGEAQDVTTAGDGTGTPFVADLVNDTFGLHQALLTATGQTPSGSPETAEESQYFNAIQEMANFAKLTITIAQEHIDAGGVALAYDDGLLTGALLADVKQVYTGQGLGVTNSGSSLGYASGDFEWSFTTPPEVGDVLTFEQNAKTSRGEVNAMSNVVFLSSYPVVADGVTDNTAAITAAIADASYNLCWDVDGVIKFDTVTIDKPLHILGFHSRHIYDRSSSGLTLAECLALPGTWVYGSSLTTPAFNCATASVGAGLVIEGLGFFQEHDDYSAPTDYPYCISDENSTSFWSGVTCADLMFINVNHGLRFTQAERTDITDVNGDFFRRGIDLAESNDVSKMERVHVWNFAQSADADAFRRSVSSDYAIYVDDSDEHFISDIFTWDRLYGTYTNKLWGSISRHTSDVVGVPLVVNNPIGFATTIDDIKANADNPVAQQEAAVLISSDSESGETASVTVSRVSCWWGGVYSYSVGSVVKVNGEGLDVVVRDVFPKYFATEAVLIQDAQSVNVDGLRCLNTVPNQVGVYDLTTVGVRNNSESAAVTLRNISAALLTYVFDGYSDNVTFDAAPNLIQDKPTISENSATCSAVGGHNARDGFFTTVTNTDTLGTFDAARDASPVGLASRFSKDKNYIFGVEYQNTTALSGASGDTRFLSHRRVDTEEYYAAFDTGAHASRRMTVQKYTPLVSGTMSAGPFARGFSGTMVIFNTFIAQSSNLVSSGGEPANVATSAAPSNTSCYALAGEQLFNSAPSAGSTRFINTSDGAPGTWISD